MIKFKVLIFMRPRLLFLFIFLGFAFVLPAQEDIKPNGYNIFYYDNGKKSSEGNMRDGKPDGYWKTYYPTGQIKTEGNRKNFQLDSIWKFYNEKGVLITSISYVNGRKEGLKKNYSPEGILLSEEMYEKDLKHGLTKFYYKSGALKETIPFDKGREEGMAFEYDEEGNITRIIEYKFGFMKNQEIVNRKNSEGKRSGRWKEFYPSLAVKWECTYADGKKNGYYKEYDEKGQLLVVQKYFMDSLITDAPELAKLDIKTEYYSDGTKKYEGTFKDGKPEGIHNLYNQKGEIVKTRVFENGILEGEGVMDEAGRQQGPWVEYFADGSVRSKGEYKDGMRIGEWQFFHNNGKVEQKGKYDKRGRAQGTWKWYYPSGNLLREENYLDGTREGAMIEYSDSNTVITKGDYVDGLREGKWIYVLLDHKEEGEYKSGQQFGEWKAYYLSTGRIKWQGSFMDGNPDGKYKELTPDGKPLREGKYIVGKKEGDWKIYGYDEETGALMYLLVITYRDGKEIKWDNVLIRPESP